MKSKKPKSRNNTAEFLTFTYQTGADGVDVHVKDRSVWLSQKGIGKLFDTTSDNVSLQKTGGRSICLLKHFYAILGSENNDFYKRRISL